MDLEDYLSLHTSAESEILQRLNRETHLKTLYPRMLSGHVMGNFLKMMVRLTHAGNVLEIGTFTGYSAISMAEALAEDGLIDTIEVNREMEEMISKYLRESGLQEKIRLHYGHALDIVPQLPGPFDLVFIDADKEHYPQYFNLVISKLRPGGIIIADNALWGGKVLEKARENDIETKGIQDFNEMVQTDPSVENVLLPIRDGVMMIWKR